MRKISYELGKTLNALDLVEYKVDACLILLASLVGGPGTELPEFKVAVSNAKQGAQHIIEANLRAQKLAAMWAKRRKPTAERAGS